MGGTRVQLITKKIALTVGHRLGIDDLRIVLLSNPLRVLCVLIVMSLSIYSPIAKTASSKNTSISIPAHLYLAGLNKHGILPALRTKFRNDGWRLVDSYHSQSGCHLSLQGVLTVKNREAGEVIVSCELSLFEPEFRLADGWTLIRIHWSGDSRSVKWLSNPARTKRPHLRLQLTAPRTGQRSITLRLVTLSGPQGSSWEKALGSP